MQLFKVCMLCELKMNSLRFQTWNCKHWQSWSGSLDRQIIVYMYPCFYGSLLICVFVSMDLCLYGYLFTFILIPWVFVSIYFVYMHHCWHGSFCIDHCLFSLIRTFTIFLKYADLFMNHCLHVVLLTYVSVYMYHCLYWYSAL